MQKGCRGKFMDVKVKSLGRRSKNLNTKNILNANLYGKLIIKIKYNLINNKRFEGLNFKWVFIYYFKFITYIIMFLSNLNGNNG